MYLLGVHDYLPEKGSYIIENESIAKHIYCALDTLKLFAEVQERLLYLVQSNI